MAGRPPSEKTFSNMLRIAINEAHEKGGTKLRAVADALVEKALTGDVPAIRELGDRIEGKVPQAVDGEFRHEAGDSLTSLLGKIAAQGSRLVTNDGGDQS